MTMRHKLLIASLLAAGLSAFVIGGAAQMSQQNPQDQATQSQSKPGTMGGGMMGQSGGQDQGMMGGGMMRMMGEMTTHHQQMSTLMNKLMESMSAIQNEKDSEALKSKLAEHQALLNQMHSQMTQQGKVMQMMSSQIPSRPRETDQSQSAHHSEMLKRGEQAMGFSQEETTHYFRLYKDGGAIEVIANDPKDTASRDQIRMHLSHIAKMFSAGNFEAPMLIHGTTPPGVPTMIVLREQIQYEFQETDNGGRVRITTANTQGTDAIHAFLLYQIVDHKTGDSPDISGEVKKK
jgi:hypothetical protein